MQKHTVHVKGKSNQQVAIQVKDESRKEEKAQLYEL